jgi:hypothetical protein
VRFSQLAKYWKKYGIKLNIAPEGEVSDPNRSDIKNKIPSNGKSATCR